jgi:hypothetical protein
VRSVHFHLMMLASMLTAASAGAADESPSPPAVRPWSAMSIVQVMVVMGGTSGMGVGAGIQMTRTVTDHVRIGGVFLAVPSTNNTESGCYYYRQCFYSFYELAPLVELHAFPMFFVDPWVRGAIGPVVIGPADQRRNDGSPVGVSASAVAGITFRVWHVAIAPYAGITAITGFTGPASTWGVQIGAEW